MWSAFTARPFCTGRERGLTIQIGDGPALAKARHRGGLRFARGRRGGRRAGRAACAGLSSRARRDARSSASDRRAQSRRRRQRHLYRRRRSSIACDTGPGNALIDDFMRARTGHSHDDERRPHAARQGRRCGGCARAGASVLRASRRKSLDRNDFRSWIAEEARLADKSVEDGAATLTAITAASVAAIVKFLPRPPQSWIVAGGGARKPTADADAVAATGAGQGRDRQCGRLVRRCAWRRRLSPSCGALAARLPLTFPDHDGVPNPARRRLARAR